MILLDRPIDRIGGVGARRGPGRRKSRGPRERRPEVERLEGRALLTAWVEQGPGPIINGQTQGLPSSNPVAGAVNQVAVDPDDNAIELAAGVDGGIWKTTDAQAANPTWMPVGDTLPSLAIGSIAFDPTNPSLAYAATGVFTNGLFSNNAGQYAGAPRYGGFYYSQDGGSTWNTQPEAPFAGLNFNTVVVAQTNNVPESPSQVFFSTGDGATGLWRYDASSGLVAVSGTGGLPAAGVSSIAVDPSNGRHLYVGVPGMGVYATTDGGQTWAQVNGAGGTALANVAGSTRIRLATTAAGAGEVYAALISGAFPGARATGVFRSADGGTTWSAMGLPVNVQGGTVAAATNATPIVVTSNNNGLNTGDFVSIAGGTGNTAVNGFYQVTVVDANTFSLNGSVGNGAYNANTATWTKIPFGVTGATNAAPIVITAANSNLNTGDQVRVAGVRGNTAANGDWTVTRVDANTFSLNGSVGNGAYVAGSGGFAVLTNVNSGGQAITNFSIAADPTNANLVYIGGDVQPVSPYVGNLYVGNAATNTWTSIVQAGANGTAPHADSRSLVFDGGNLDETDDAGLYRLTTPSVAATRAWSSFNGNIRPTEFYSVAYDDVNQKVFGGGQDVGAPDQSATGSPNNLLWRDVLQSDGAIAQVDNVSTPNVSYHYTTNLNFSPLHVDTVTNANMATGTYPTTYIATTAPAAITAASNGTPIVITSPGHGLMTNDVVQITGVVKTGGGAANANGIFLVGRINANTFGIYNLTTAAPIAGNGPYTANTGTFVKLGSLTQVDNSFGSISLVPYATDQVSDGSGARRLLIGSTSLYESMDGGQTVTMVANAIGTVQAIAYGSRQAGTAVPNVAYVGTNDGNELYYRAPAGGAFNALPAYSAAGGGTPRSIALDPQNYKKVYVLDTNGLLWASFDAGQHWANITGDVAKLTVQGTPLNRNLTSIAVVSPDTSPAHTILLVAGFGGVAASPFPGIGGTTPHWSLLGTGLPTVLVTDIHWDAPTNRAIIGTFGRGAWTLDAPNNPPPPVAPGVVVASPLGGVADPTGGPPAPPASAPSAVTPTPPAVPAPPVPPPSGAPTVPVDLPGPSFLFPAFDPSLSPAGFDLVTLAQPVPDGPIPPSAAPRRPSGPGWTFGRPDSAALDPGPGLVGG